MEKVDIFKFLLKLRQIQKYENFDLFMTNVISLSEKLNSNFKQEYEKCVSENNFGEVLFDPKMEELELENQSYNSELYKSLIILFYSETEIKLKEILRLHCFTLEKHKGKRQFLNIDIANYENLEKRFHEKLSLELSKINGFKELSEIRLLSNCLKHSCKVNKSLSIFNQMKWGENGDPIVLEFNYIDFLIKSSKNFMSDLVKKLLEENK